MDIDVSLKKFEEFLKEFEKFKEVEITESDTRSKIIDKILIDILGWKENDITREKHIESGYYDYKISIPGFLMIIEAKRQFKELTLPLNRKRTSINSLFKENKDVIIQIRNYLFDSGISNGIITNGKQFIIGRFINLDGTDWKKNQCLIFNGFEDIRKRFIEFTNNLSRDSIIKEGGFYYLNENKAIKSYKIFSTLIDREKEIVRNNLSGEIAPLIEKVFGEIFHGEGYNDIEFIKNCFITNEEIKKNRNEIERIFGDKPPKLSEVIPIRNTTSLIKEVKKEIEEFPITIKEDVPPKPIIIVGSKGAGKTTFINYLFAYKTEGKSLKDHPHIYIDFRKYFNQEKDVDTNKIAEDILLNLYERYDNLKLYTLNVLKRIYFKEIRYNNESVWANLKKTNPERYNRKINEFFEEKRKDSLSHLELLSKYLIRERRMRLLLIFDNADQFDIEIQKKVFLFASSLNRNSNCGVIVSLREGYYYKWRNSPPFDAFESNVYHITAPKYGEVLQARINYTINKLDFKGKTKGISKKGTKLELNNEAIFEFLSGLKNSLFSENNSEIIDFLNYSTFPNIREGLRLFKLFLISGYTDVSEYIMRVRFSQKDHISIPFHEFFKSIGLNNKLYYNHEISVIPNLFYPTDESTDHFLKIWILKYLQRKLDDGGNTTKFTMIKDLIDFFTDIGYKFSIVISELKELLKTEMIDTENLISDIVWNNLTTDDFNVSITPKGSYYIKVVKNRFYYIDLILQDTPIYDKHFFEKIKEVFPLADNKGYRQLHERVIVAKEFLEYLKYKEKEQSPELLLIFGSIHDEILSFGMRKDFRRIEHKLPTTKNIVHLADGAKNEGDSNK